MSTGKRARERDETILDEGGPPKKPRTGGISWEDAFPAKFRSVVNLSKITSRMKTLDSGHIGPLFVVKIDHFTSPTRTRLTLSESLGGKQWFECEVHHSIARINDPKAGDRIRLSLSDARPSFRARPGFHDCRVDIYGDYFLFIDSSKSGSARLLTNTTLPPVPSSTPDQSTASDRIQAQDNTTGAFSMADIGDSGKPRRQRRRSKKTQERVSFPTPLHDPPTLPPPVQEESVETSNISLISPPRVESTNEPKGFTVDIHARQVPHNTQEAETATQSLLAVPEGGYYKLDSLENLPLKSRINVIAYVTGVAEVKKCADWGKSYHLSDPSRPESMKGFTVNLFSKAADWLPDAEVGQILILRSLLLVEFSGHKKATGYADGSNQYVWAGFDPGASEVQQIFYTDPKVRKGAPFFPVLNDSPEVKYCKELVKWRNEFHANAVQVQFSRVSSRAGKERLISELSDRVAYFNCTIELLSKQETNEDRTVLLVTDYTVNDNLYRPASEGLPVGHRVLQVKLFDNVHVDAKDMRVGKYYRLKNLRLDPKGSGFVAVMGGGYDKESTAHQERRIQPLNQKDAGVQDEAFVKLLQRKTEYITDPPIIEDGPPLFELLYGNPRRRESANVTVLEPVLSKSVSLPPLQPQSHKRPDTTHYPFHSIKELMSMNDCPDFAQVRFKVTDYRPTNLDEAVVAYCTKCKMYLPSQQRRCTYCGDGAGKHLDFRLLVALEVVDEAGYSMEVWIRRSQAKALIGIRMPHGTLFTDLDHQAIVQMVECKMRELRDEGKQAGGKFLSALVKRVDEPTKNENEWKRAFEMERWDFPQQ